jgi:hypothetical protein
MIELALASPMPGAHAVRNRQDAPLARTMPRGAILRIPDPAGSRIECLAGSLWVTQDNDPRDIMLEAGETCELSGRARVLVQALEAARIQLRRIESP